jgi:rhomboid protease GluP
MGDESFAAYLARYYEGHKGFRAGTVSEAEALLRACDRVLTQSDGLTFRVICIVDREKDPGRIFAPSPDALREIGEKCLKYAGKVNNTQMPVTLQVVEVGRASAADRTRLAAYKRKSLLGKVILMAWTLDPVSREVWTNAPLGGLFVGKRALQALLRSPRLPDDKLRAPQRRVARERFPALTIGLIALLVATFAGELVYGVKPWSGLLAPDVRTLVALGGLNRTLVLQSGEWQRLFSAPLLHGDAVHLAFNAVALYMAGAVLESLVGRRWFFALFVVGALGGGLMSLALNPPSVVSVGASGGIMGLCAAALVCSFRYPSGAGRMQIQMSMVQMLVPALIPLATSRTGTQIDFGAHLGGAITGGLVGLAMLTSWRHDAERPAFPGGATGLSALGVLLFALSAVPVVRNYHSYALDLDALLIPAKELPTSNADAKARARELLARYPRDPRAHLYQAGSLIDQAQLPGAARELRAGLAEGEILRTQFKPELEAQMRGMLALVLHDLNQPAEARAAAEPTCAVAAPAFARMRELLIKTGLCDY